MTKANLCFSVGQYKLVRYSDAEWAGYIDTKRSTLGYLVTFAGGAAYS